MRVATIDTEDEDRRDTRMVGFGPGGAEREWRQFYRVFGMGWWPTACVIAMVLATPLPWRRRGFALLGGVLIANAILMLRIGALVFLNYSITGADDPQGWMHARDVAAESFTSWVPGLVTVLISWASVAQPASTIDLESARGLFGGRRSAPPREGVGEEAAGLVAEEGQQQREQSADRDE